MPGGIFKNALRVCNTVCMWRYLPFAQFLGGGVNLASISNFCQVYPPIYFLYLILAKCTTMYIIDNMDSDNRCSCLGS